MKIIGNKKFKLILDGCGNKKWTEEEWSILRSAIEELVEKKILKYEEIMFQGFIVDFTNPFNPLLNTKSTYKKKNDENAN